MSRKMRWFVVVLVLKDDFLLEMRLSEASIYLSKKTLENDFSNPGTCIHAREWPALATMGLRLSRNSHLVSGLRLV